jgi:hypothetical protein
MQSTKLLSDGPKPPWCSCTSRHRRKKYAESRTVYVGIFQTIILHFSMSPNTFVDYTRAQRSLSLIPLLFQLRPLVENHKHKETRMMSVINFIVRTSRVLNFKVSLLCSRSFHGNIHPLISSLVTAHLIPSCLHAGLWLCLRCGPR